MRSRGDGAHLGRTREVHVHTTCHVESADSRLWRSLERAQGVGVLERGQVFSSLSQCVTTLGRAEQGVSRGGFLRALPSKGAGGTCPANSHTAHGSVEIWLLLKTTKKGRVAALL